jgi:hypothetical protein
LPPPPVATVEDEPPPIENRSDQERKDNLSSTTTATDTTSESRAPLPPSISTIFTPTTGTGTTAAPTGDAAYSQARQILAHLARDWSAAGFSVRQTLYPWCQDQLHRYSYYDNADNSNSNNGSISSNRSVLVPGAGLGRLAWELAQDGWTVHALEASPVMAAAAATMLHWRPTNIDKDDNNDDTTRHTIQIHPYAMDIFANEVDANDRYEEVTIPDVHPGQASRQQRGRRSRKRQRKQAEEQHHGSLSYTSGMFGSDSTPTSTTSSTSSAYIEQQYAAIVTCFFIDTATNIYDYLDTIATSVETGGLWINVGPLQWHGNAIVSMTATDLRSVLESDYCQGQGGCWEILEWSVDSEPVPYRTSDDSDGTTHNSRGPRSTNYDGFRPLRFVARKL